MDGERFDLLARIAGARGTRRGALAALLALASGFAADLGPGASAKKKRKKKCKPACPPGQTCKKGKCACPAGLRVCAAACCFEDQACDQGTCVPCTLIAGTDPAADGQALKALVGDPTGPSTIWLGEGVYEMQAGNLPPFHLLRVPRNVAIASCNPERPATISCPVVGNHASCVEAYPGLEIPVFVRLQGLGIVGPGYEALDQQGRMARGATAAENATLELEGCTVGGFTFGAASAAGGTVRLAGGNLVTDNAIGLYEGSSSVLTCSGDDNRSTGNASGSGRGDCLCIPDPDACGCGTLAPCA